MTSSIPNDSLQTLLERSNQKTVETLDAIKAELEHIYEEDSQFPDDLLRDADNFYSVLQKIDDAQTHHEKTEIVLRDFQDISRNFLDQYSDFLSSELIESISKYTEYFLGLAYLSKVGEVLDNIFYITDLKDQSSHLLTVILELSKIIESYIDHFNEDILRGIKNIALDKIKWSYRSTNSEEVERNFVMIRQVSRGILYQIEHSQQDHTLEDSLNLSDDIKKSSDSEFDDLLNETQGIWTKRNGLAYQEQVRTGKNPDNIKQEMTSQEAAQFLKIPYVSLVKRLEQGEIPYHEVNSCKRIRLEDLIVYKQKRDEQRRQGIKEFTAFLEEEGFYNEDDLIDDNPLSDAEFDNLLNETQGIWTKGDSLEYQQKLREEW